LLVDKKNGLAHCGYRVDRRQQIVELDTRLRGRENALRQRLKTALRRRADVRGGIPHGLHITEISEGAGNTRLEGVSVLKKELSDSTDPIVVRVIEETLSRDQHGARVGRGQGADIFDDWRGSVDGRLPRHVFGECRLQERLPRDEHVEERTDRNLFTIDLREERLVCRGV
jgi:hypothetical protein